MNSLRKYFNSTECNCLLCKLSDILIKNKYVPWITISRIFYLSLMELNPQQVYFSVKTDIPSFIKSHWKILSQLNQFTETSKWRKSMLDAINHSRFFQSGKEEYKICGYWKLKDVSIPVVDNWNDHMNHKKTIESENTSNVKKLNQFNQMFPLFEMNHLKQLNHCKQMKDLNDYNQLNESKRNELMKEKDMNCSQQLTTIFGSNETTPRENINSERFGESSFSLVINHNYMNNLNNNLNNMNKNNSNNLTNCKSISNDNSIATNFFNQLKIEKDIPMEEEKQMNENKEMKMEKQLQSSIESNEQRQMKDLNENQMKQETNSVQQQYQMIIQQSKQNIQRLQSLYRHVNDEMKSNIVRQISQNEMNILRCSQLLYESTDCNDPRYSSSCLLVRYMLK